VKPEMKDKLAVKNVVKVMKSKLKTDIKESQDGWALTISEKRESLDYLSELLKLVVINQCVFNVQQNKHIQLLLVNVCQP